MMAKEQKNGAAPGDLRDTILSTALHLFTTKGYFNTSVHDIKRQAGISIGAVYHHFKSKEDIAKAIYEQLLESMTASMNAIMQDNPSARERCKAVMTHLFEMTETHPEEMGFMLHAKHQEFMPSAVPICSSRPLTMMREMVAQGIATGEIREMDVTLATTCLFGGMFRMINLRLDRVVNTPLPAQLDPIWECGWKGVAR